MPKVQRYDDFDHIIDADYYSSVFGTPTVAQNPHYALQHYALRIQADQAFTEGVRLPITGSPTKGWCGFSFMMADRTAVGDVRLLSIIDAATGEGRVAVGWPNQRAYAYVLGGGTIGTGPEIKPGVWNWVEAIYDVNDGTGVKKLYWRINGVDQTTSTLTAAASTITGAQMLSSSTDGILTWYCGWWAVGSADSTSDWLNPARDEEAGKRFILVVPDSDFVTDIDRITNYEGDGRAADGSTGFWVGRNNLYSNGGFESNTTGWSSTNSALTRVITDSKFGIACCEVNTNGSSASEGIVPSARTDVDPSSPYVLSAWVKGPNGATMEISIDEWTSAPALVGSTTQNFTCDGTWQRVYVSRLFGATGVSAFAGIRTRTSVQDILFYVDGMQLELASEGAPRRWPHPYKETNGLLSSNASRFESEMYLPLAVAPPSFLTTQGWIACRWRQGHDDLGEADNNGIFQIGAPPNRITVYSNGLNAVQLAFEDGSGTSTSNVTLPSHTADTVYTIVAKWTSTQQGLAINDGDFTDVITRKQPVIPSTAVINIGCLAQWFGGLLNGDIFWFAMGTGNPANADVDTIHALSNNPSTKPAFTGLEPWFYWDGISAFAEGYDIGTYTAVPPMIRR